MPIYRVTVRQLVSDDDLLKRDDQTDNPRGVYDYVSDNAEAALDEFHNGVPIACLDDFEVTVNELVWTLDGFMDWLRGQGG